MTARFLSAALLLGLASSVKAHDWPMDRHDAQRSGASAQELAADLHLHWSRELPALEPAWPDQPKMQFDAAYHPVVLGKTLFISSSREDSVTAYDAETGEEKWKFLADGPVRFAPVGWEGNLYFAADDGYLYCLDVEKGTLRWKFRGGPSERKILGNERLISTWPARGAPVVADGKVDFAASIWPFMGVFIHALDARTGRVIWTNDGDGSIFIQQPHHADAFAGVAPQGAFAVVGDRLLVPGGRSRS
jgi:glucose dehydrogenase